MSTCFNRDLPNLDNFLVADAALEVGAVLANFLVGTYTYYVT